MQGVPAWGGVPTGMGGTCLGVYLPAGCMCPGVYLPGGCMCPGVYLTGGCTCPGGYLSRYSSPENRITDKQV